jgi:hypothetical protein
MVLCQLGASVTLATNFHPLHILQAPPFFNSDLFFSPLEVEFLKLFFTFWFVVIWLPKLEL